MRDLIGGALHQWHLIYQLLFTMDLPKICIKPSQWLLVGQLVVGSMLSFFILQLFLVLAIRKLNLIFLEI